MDQQHLTFRQFASPKHLLYKEAVSAEEVKISAQPIWISVSILSINLLYHSLEILVEELFKKDSAVLAEAESTQSSAGMR